MDKTVLHDRTMNARGSCDQCKYCGVAMQAGPGSTVQLICRNEPPKVTALLVPTSDGPQWMGSANWPAVTKTDWCGRFEAQTH